ncbi:acetate kinase [Xylariaceae sp. FL1651]|nr:acetate kinase [Xylariaceae sp. FL1651]
MTQLQDRVGLTNDAFEVLLRTLVDDDELPEISNKSNIAIVCHRICVFELPDAVNVACFDSRFHASIPEHTRTYPIDPNIAKKQLRKYGFHGTSYAFITRSIAGGASARTIRGGKSWNTAIGLTPLAGLPGATRILFSIIPAKRISSHIPRAKDLHISRAEGILNKESGWKALTGKTNFGDIISRSDNTKHKLAFDIFADRICGYLGAYYVALGGRLDALLFASGIGEKSDMLRNAVVNQTSCLRFELDETANAHKIENVEQDVGNEGSRHRTLVCLTAEQFEMVRNCAEG